MSKEKSITKNAIFNVLKQCVSVIIPLVMYPYVSRTLGTSNFGKVSFAESIVSFFITFSMLGVPAYAIREGARVRDRKKEIQDFSGEVFTISIISMALSILLLILAVIAIHKLRQEKYLVLVFSVNILASTLGRDWLNTIYEDFTYISLRYIILHCLSLICVLFIVNKQSDYIYYACIISGASFFSEIINVFHTRKYVSYGIASIGSTKKHLKPILYLFGVALAVKVYVVGDISLLGLLRNDTEVGIYSLASKIYIIIKLLFNAIAAVVIPRASVFLGKNNTTQYKWLVGRARAIIYALLVPAVVGAFSLSKEMLIVLGGNEYAVGYGCLELLSFALLFAVMGNFYSGVVLIPFRKEKIFTYTTAIAAIFNLVANALLIPSYGMYAAAATTLASECFVFAMCKRASVNALDRLKKKKVIVIIIGGGVVYTVCKIVHLVNLSALASVIVGVIAGICIYFMYLFSISKILDIEW